MDGRHGAAVGQGDVIELLGEPGRDPRIEAHELIGFVAARACGWPASTSRRQLDPAAVVLHPLLQPASTYVATVGKSVPHGGGLDLRRHRAAALTIWLTPTANRVAEARLRNGACLRHEATPVNECSPDSATTCCRFVR